MTEVCVLGGGPAGAVAAYSLARLGVGVTLVARPLSAAAVCETAAPSLAALLQDIGLGDVAALSIERIAPEGLTCWGDATPALRSTPSLLLRRDRFDALLRRAAVDAGAMLIEATGAPRPVPQGGWRIGLGARELAARFLVDARGRRRGGRRGGATVALVAHWRGARLPAATCLEALDDAWIWGGAGPGELQTTACFVEARRLAGLGATGRAGLCATLIGRTRLFAPLLAGEMTAPPAVRDASARVGADIAGGDRIAIGDAAVAVEPLSSQGLQGAVVSALQGAAVVRTALGRPQDGELAFEFHRTSRNAAARAAARHAAEFHALARDRFDSSFRQEPPAPPAIPKGSLRLSPAARIDVGPVLNGDSIERARVLTHPGLDCPVARLGGIELAGLLEATSFPAGPAELHRLWARRHGSASAEDALRWLCANGVLAPV